MPRTRLGEALEEIGRLAARAGLRVANVFHAGDGNLHPLILFDGREPGAVERAEALAGEILDLCVAPRRLDHRRARHRRREARLPAADVRRADAGRDAPDRAAPSTRSSSPTAARCSRGAHDAATHRRDDAVSDAVRALQDAVREHPRVLPRGGGSKPALSTPPEGVVPLVVSGLRGIVEYDPEELTITALAGTPVRVVQAALAAHGQHLPFDPPLARAGATLGGVGRRRHVGIRRLPPRRRARLHHRRALRRRHRRAGRRRRPRGQERRRASTCRG